MRTKFLICAFFSAILLSGCFTGESNIKSKPGENKNIATQLVDLNGDGVKEIVETQDKFDTDSLTVITVKKQLKNKTIEKIDSFTFPGRTRRLEFIELFGDGRKQITVSFDDKEKIPSIIVYELKNGKFSEMFKAASKYGIDAQLSSALPRIKIGKLPHGGDDSPNRVPDWETWVWTGDKFIRD